MKHLKEQSHSYINYMQITCKCGSGGFEPRAWRPLAKGHGSSHSIPSHKRKPEKAEEAVRKRIWGHFQPPLFSLLTVLVGGEREWEGQRAPGPAKGTAREKNCCMWLLPTPCSSSQSWTGKQSRTRAPGPSRSRLHPRKAGREGGSSSCDPSTRPSSLTRMGQAPLGPSLLLECGRV